MISLLWSRYGPYHLARLDALQKHSPSSVVGLEMFREDKTYQWSKHEAGRDDLITLLPGEVELTPFAQAKAVQVALDRLQPEVVGICGYSFPYALGALRWCLKNKRGAVLFSDNMRDDVQRSRWKEWIKGWVVRQFGSALVAGASHAQYLQELGMAGDVIFDGYDTVETAHFSTPHPEAERIREDIGGGQPFFVCVARLQPKKNLAFLIEAYALYRKRTLRPWKLVILGDGPLRAELAARLAALGLTDSVLMPGFLQYPVLPAWYQAAGALLLPSMIEQWGLVANEALAAGLPAIVSNRCGCAGEIVLDARNGWVLSPTDLESWAKAMHVLTEDAQERARMGSVSREIMAEWGVDRFALNFLKAAEVAKERAKGMSPIDNVILSALSTREEAKEAGTVTASGEGKPLLLWERFGPYHLARYKALAEWLSIKGLQVYRSDAFYKWDVIEGLEEQGIETLFPEPTRENEAMQGIAVGGMLDRMDPGVVAIPGYSFRYAIGALRWCLRNRRASVLFSVNCAHDTPRVWWKEAIKGFVVRQFGAALVGGKMHADYLVSLGMPRERIHYGYNTVDTSWFATPHPVATRVRQEVDKGRPFFLCVTRFLPKKNLTFLLRAYAAYLSQAGESAWKLVLAGDGAQKQELEALAAELGLGERLVMPGFLQYGILPAWYQAAGAYLLPSLIEQWGLVINEAMSAGLPVVVSDRCGCHNELVQPENGFVLGPDDLEAWANAMLQISSVPESASKMGDASREIMKEWTTARFAAGFLAASRDAQANVRGANLLQRMGLALLARKAEAPEVGGGKIA